MSPGSDDPADPKDIDTSAVAYIWINPAFSLGDQRAPDIDVMRHMKADIPPTIVFFGDQDGYKKGWDTALRKWKSLGAKNIEVRIAQGEGHGFVSNNIDWETITYIEIDRFLVKQGFITGEPTLAMPDDEKKFVEDTGDPE
jgi:acetyl esterase